MSLADYRSALTTPGAPAPVLAAALGRFPIAMFGMATLLYVQRTSGSFATAGLVSAGVLAGVSLGSVVQGRIIHYRPHVEPSAPHAEPKDDGGYHIYDHPAADHSFWADPRAPKLALAAVGTTAVAA